MDEGNHEYQQPQPRRSEPQTEVWLAPPQTETGRNEPQTDVGLAPPQPKTGRNEPATMHPSGLPSAGVEYDSDLELSREADRLVITEEEMAEWKSGQCRSRFEVPFTRRKIQILSRHTDRHMCFTHWQFEVRKPDELVRIQTIQKMNSARMADNLPPLDAAGFEELWQQERRDDGLPELTKKEITKKWNENSVRGLLECKRMFETDVEAEVAGTVLSILYEDYAKLIRDESYETHRTKIRFHGCRWLIDYVIERNGRPDITDNVAMKDFVSLCSNEFKRIAGDAKLGNGECPEELKPVVQEYLYNAMRYTRVYPPSELPKPKIVYKHGKKRKDSSWLELECCCNVHKNNRNVIKWDVPRYLCLCQGLTYRLTLNTEPEKDQRKKKSDTPKIQTVNE